MLGRGGDDVHAGIVFRAAQQMFDSMAEQTQAEGWTFDVNMSVIEVYCEVTIYINFCVI